MGNGVSRIKSCFLKVQKMQKAPFLPSGSMPAVRVLSTGSRGGAYAAGHPAGILYCQVLGKIDKLWNI